MKKAAFIKKKNQVGISMKTDEFQNKVNFLFLLINVVHHNIVYIFKSVKYKKKKKISQYFCCLICFWWLSLKTLKNDRKKKVIFVTNTLFLQLDVLIGTNRQTIKRKSTKGSAHHCGHSWICLTQGRVRGQPVAFYPFFQSQPFARQRITLLYAPCGPSTRWS